ncbi:hypothetical protein JHK82_027983 [Glycine max]|nr:hypothetical protein JHK82_027983 [Glycine max]
MAFVAYGFVLQYDKGDFLKAFSRRLGHCTILKAKLWAIIFGMNMACDSSYKAIIIETDCVEAVELVEDPRYHEDQFVDLSSKIVKTKEKIVSLTGKNPKPKSRKGSEVEALHPIPDQPFLLGLQQRPTRINPIPTLSSLQMTLLWGGVTVQP